jgi:hypothetical protein
VNSVDKKKVFPLQMHELVEVVASSSAHGVLEMIMKMKMIGDDDGDDDDSYPSLK